MEHWLLVVRVRVKIATSPSSNTEVHLRSLRYFTTVALFKTSANQYDIISASILPLPRASVTSLTVAVPASYMLSAGPPLTAQQPSHPSSEHSSSPQIVHLPM